MQEFTVFDMVVIGLTVLLGLKGLFRGLIKEVFGLVGIVGGIFIASRMALDIGNTIAPVLALENVATIKLIGFILGLVGFWVIVYILGMVLSKIFQASGLGVFDRVFGFIFGACKVFLIFSIIAYGLYQLKSFKTLMNETVGNSIVFPFLIDAGGFIIKLDTQDLIDLPNNEDEKVNPVEESSKEVDTTNNTNEDSAIKEDITNSIDKAKEASEKLIEDVKETTNTAIKDAVNEKVNEVLNINTTNTETTNEQN